MHSLRQTFLLFLSFFLLFSAQVNAAPLLARQTTLVTSTLLPNTGLMQTCNVTLTPVKDVVVKITSCILVVDGAPGTTAVSSTATLTGTTAIATGTSDSGSSATVAGQSTSTSASSTAIATATESSLSSAASSTGSSAASPTVIVLTTSAAPATETSSSASPSQPPTVVLGGSASATASGSSNRAPSTTTSASSATATPTATPALPADEQAPTATQSLPASSTTAVDPNGTAVEQVSPTSTEFTLPGKKLSVLPIGLGVFAGISVIALIVVGLVTYERTKYRKKFRERKLAESGAAMGYGANYDNV